MILLAVGSDTTCSGLAAQGGDPAGLNTGIIRGMGATGRVVTAAGLVFAFTMMSMIVSDLRVVGQLGMTIGIGLLVDTLIVRSFMTLDRRRTRTLVLVATEHLQDRGERRSRARIRREHRADFKAGDGANCRSSKLNSVHAGSDT